MTFLKTIAMSLLEKLHDMLFIMLVRWGFICFAWSGNVLPSAFKNEILLGTHNFTSGTGDSFKVALYDNTATPVSTDTVYGGGGLATGELPTAGGYTQNSKAVTVASTFPKLVSGVAVIDFDDVSWTSATFTARGAAIYNSSKSNKLVCELDFGSDKAVSSGTFTIQFPTPDQTNGIVRIN